MGRGDGLVVINGVVIVILALTGIRTMIFTAVPAQLKAAITVGIGLFIAFIGLVDSGFVRTTKNASPPLQLGEDGSIAALPTIVFLIGLVIIGTLMARKVRGALLIGIVATTVIAIILQAIFKVPTSVDSPTGWNLNAPASPAPCSRCRTCRSSATRTSSAPSPASARSPRRCSSSPWSSRTSSTPWAR